MKTTIIVNLQVEGQHRWLKCPILEMAFLKSFHRHIFHIQCEVEVSHNDRDIEIIMFKREVLDYLNRNYYNLAIHMCNFGDKSCEMIATDLVEAYAMTSCQVLEDGENGAKVYRS